MHLHRPLPYHTILLTIPYHTIPYHTILHRPHILCRGSKPPGGSVMSFSEHSGALAWGVWQYSGRTSSHVYALMICWHKQVRGPPSVARARGSGADHNPTWQLFSPAWHVPLWSNDFLAIRLHACYQAGPSGANEAVGNVLSSLVTTHWGRVPLVHGMYYPVLAWSIQLLAYAMPSVPVPPIIT